MAFLPWITVKVHCHPGLIHLMLFSYPSIYIQFRVWYIFLQFHIFTPLKTANSSLFYKLFEKFWKLPYLPYIFGRIKIIIFFTVRTFNLEKNYNFFSVRIFTNAEKLPIIEGIHRYICGNFSVYTNRCENNLYNYMLLYQLELCKINLHDDFSDCFFNCMTTAWTGA